MSLNTILPYCNALVLLVVTSWGLQWILQRWKLPLSFTLMMVGFILKLMAGVAYGYIFLHYYHGDDTWAYQREALAQHDLLLQNPHLFFSELLPRSTLSHYSNSMEGLAFYANRLEGWCITKPFALLHFVTGGNYYINLIVYNFISMIGLLLLYRLYCTYMPEKRTGVYVILFLFPPIVFWLSGIRGDGYLVTALAMMLYQFEAWITKKQLSTLLGVAIGALFVLIFRGYLLLLFVPMLFCWWLVIRKAVSLRRSILLVFGSAVLFFIFSGVLPAPFNLWVVLQEKQAAFLGLHGNTRFDLTPLDGSMASLIEVLPQAVSHTFFRPTLWEFRGPLQAMAAIDVLGLVLFFLYAFSKHWREGRDGNMLPIPLLLMLTGVFIYIFIGYTVPFPGAIVRYKVVGEVFLFMGILGKLPLQKNT